MPDQESDDIEGARVEAGPSLFAGNTSIKEALKELRLRLLDLTGRNRLVNFKHTPGKSLQFVHTSIDGSFRRLTGETGGRITISPLPEPERGEWVVRAGRHSRPEPRDYAVQLGIDPSYELFRRSGRALTAAGTGSHASTLLYAEDLGKHCRKLEREAKLAIEETGANMLYLALGFLEYSEAPDSDKIYRAPLVCIPVSLTRTDTGQYSTFFINYTGEELADNLSLREKIKRDVGLNLPGYDADAEGSIESYFDTVSDVIATRPNWHVRRMMTLTLLSFANMLLVRDLDPDNWPAGENGSALLAHPLVKQVFEGRPSAGEAQYAGEYAIDDHPKGDLPLIYDADSSQHSALIDVLEGKNRVIEGPPGTGKSQTITNLVAAALQAGKKVLFVAEKLAALEVVKSRLALAGLDPFVLELHSNKANKKRVLDDLGARVKLHIPTAIELPDLLERQKQKRRELKAYADLMNTKLGNHLDLTLHQVMWRAELNRMRCGASSTAVQHLDYTAAPRTLSTQLAEICDRLRYLAGQLEPIGGYGPSHPLWGFFPTEFKPEDDLPVQKVLEHFASKFEAFAGAMTSTAELLGGANLNLSAKSAEQLISVLGNIAPADSDDISFGLLPRLFDETDPTGAKSLSTLLDLSEKAKEISDAEALVQRHLKTTKPASDELVQSAKATLLGLKTRGLSGLTESELAEMCNSLRRVMDAAGGALKDLAAAPLLVAMDEHVTADGIHKLKAIMAAIEAAPRDQLHLQHPGLRGASVIATLEHAAERLLKIEQTQQFCSAKFYMDTLPTESDLAAAILTLREGDAWYRIFQKSWRQAVNLHKRLEQQKSKKTTLHRQQELELLRQLLKDQAAWNSDLDLRAAAGPHFKVEKTPLHGLLALAKWIRATDEVLEAVDLPISLLDGTCIDKALVNRLVNQAPMVNAALAALDRFDNVCRSQFANALPSALKEFSDADWHKRISAGQSALTALSNAEALLARYVKLGTAAESGLKAIGTSRDMPVLVQKLADRADGKAIFGDAFAGRHTDFESALAAHTYGALVKRVGLPASIEKALISPECVANHGLLSTYSERINHGWQAVLDFTMAMSKFGQFDSAAWVDPTSKSTSEYASGLAAKTRNAAERTGGLMAWAQYIGARADVTKIGLEGFVVRLESGAVPADKLQQAFLYRFYATVAQSVFDSAPTLRQFSGRRHSSVRQEYANLDNEIIKLRGLQVARDCRSLSRPPAGTSGVRVGDKTEMELLKLLIPQQKPRVPVRQMLLRAGKAIQELKPCFMMGPQAVAQFLSPGYLHFDIVVMDEASQLRPEQAIGAIARGTQLVVVGDPKQLPPTSFFARMAASDGDGDGAGQLAATEAESILDVCISHFQPVRTLRWHYRSRHESLIAFSNHHFYRGNLVVFPSPYPKSLALGLRYQFVADGVYENQMNQIEARRVVDAAVEHILHRSGDSLGIVTLNIKQRDLVAEMLDERLRSLCEAVAFKERWEAAGMGLFVKNLENVQGDERDCIFISTTFGKPKGTDAVRQNFGPISRDGGWRRLNVLFTRARKSVAVFSSMRPEDIVVDSKTPEGTRALRNYLEFARDGVLPVEQETGLPPDSDFEVAVMDVLKGKGFEVVPQLGVAGFRIDIAVKHPGHKSGYLAAIECDGASYHSGVSVRDRDRIRQEILEGLGWRGRIWRIWSTDWFRNPLSETDRLLQFLEILRNQPIADEYIVPDVLAAVPQPLPTITSNLFEEEEQANKLVFADEDEDLEIQVGDLITYAPLDAPDGAQKVKLTARQTDPSAGLVSESTPLGAVLLGAVVGDQVVLRVPGKAPQSFVILGIKRSAEAALQ